MRKTPPVIDAEFEVVSGPSPVRWGPKPRRDWNRILWGPKDGLQALRLIYGGVIVFFALLTALMGLSGGDIDTRDDLAADAARQPAAVTIIDAPPADAR